MRSLAQLALETGRSLYWLCERYFDAYEAAHLGIAPHHEATKLACERYGREAGRRAVENKIPHAGYWFEQGQK